MDCIICGPCFRCAASGATCEVEPESIWLVTCESATIAMTMPNGAAWDSGAGSDGTGPAPDPFCQFISAQDPTFGGETSWPDDTFTPVWGQAVGTIRPSMLAAPGARFEVWLGDDDGSLRSFDQICTVPFRPGPADFDAGGVQLASEPACRIKLSLACTQ
jgi:hypothetical protein